MKKARQSLVDLKLERDGLVLVVSPYEDLEEVISSIDRLFSEMGDFVSKGDELILSIPEGEKAGDDLPALVSAVSKFGLRVSQVVVGRTKKTMKLSNEGRATKSRYVSEGTRVMKRNLRSGQMIVHNGGVMIFGNVHPGAAIFAGGSVVVFGSLKGQVKAGLREGESSVIAALEFAPTFVQISSFVMNEPPSFSQPAVAHVRTGRIVVEPYDSARFQDRGDID
ncbi:MAG: septum site-determining protein MinC [Thermotogae bacterium]|nr:septum site-determining protein MinC [Thermotogota bacterium]